MSTDATRPSEKPQNKKRHHNNNRRPFHKKRRSNAPNDGTLNGVLLVDKPRGMTSFDVVEVVRELFSVQRVGHCGTLDPLATGLLVLLIGEATKVAQFLTDEDKAYEGEIKLGAETDTDDAEGQILHTTDCSQVTLADVQAAAAKFIGEIMQKPPRYSAQKRGGVRAYERARAGEDFEPESRKVLVKSFEAFELKDGIVRFRCHVGKGTYVRSLARDIGAELKVFGHVLSLRRTFSGGFDGVNSLTLEQLRELPVETRMLRVLSLGAAWRPRPMFRVGGEDVARLRRGQQITVNKEAIDEASGDTATALALGEDGTAFAVGKLTWDRITRMFVFQPERNLFVDGSNKA